MAFQMAYQVLALKYRPQTFKDVIGQNPITRTLENAISANRVAHAILFTGPRGTGKTTTARILAKAMNCEKGPISEPCNMCRFCKEITHGSCADVFEIDGASNNNVDQIRELRDNIAYLPAACKYKIYIIDEVHMLSTAAFNALLKTLEEPPEHILFIFATTEPHKIPATILSRCQRHNLGRIPINDIAENIKKLCEKEGYLISEKSATIIAAEADGSIRDSLSLTDRILSASPSKEIDHQSILENLGLIDTSLLFEISKATIKSDGAKLIEIVDKVNDLGLDLKKFYSNLIKHFRNLVIIKICGETAEAINISDFERNEIKKTVENTSQSYLTWLLNSLLNEETMIKFSSHTKTAVEMALLKLLQIREGVEIDTIISKLDDLKTGLRTSEKPNDIKKHIQAENKTNIADKTPETIKETVGGYSEPGHLHAEPEKNKTWAQFLKILEKKFPFIAVLFKKGAFKGISENKAILELNSTPFDIARLDKKRDGIDQLCKDYFGPDIKLKIILKSDTKHEIKKDEKTFSEKKQSAMNQPLVTDTMRIFNGSIIDIK